jgi:hypothetical protein
MIEGTFRFSILQRTCLPGPIEGVDANAQVERSRLSIPFTQPAHQFLNVVPSLLQEREHGQNNHT